MHCVWGVSRSAIVCAAWLVAAQGLSVDAAIEALRAERPCVKPNNDFIEQLRDWAAAR